MSTTITQAFGISSNSNLYYSERYTMLLLSPTRRAHDNWKCNPGTKRLFTSENKKVYRMIQSIYLKSSRR